MTTKHTELVFILDRSGSMSGLEQDTIGGYNSMLQKQKKEEGEATITTVLFDHEINTLHDAVDIQKVEEMTERDYEVGGMTALVDAIGFTIQRIKSRPQARNNQVLFVISTDGMENSSKEFTVQKVKEMIQRQKKEADWKFVFLGANIDAISEAERFGIDKDFAVNYHADEQGLQANYDAIHEVASSIRKGVQLSDSWKSDIEADFQSRDCK